MKKMRGLITIFLVLSFILTALYLSNVVLVQAQQSVVDEEVLNSLDIEGKAKVIVLLKDSDKNIRLRSAKRNTETFSVNGFKKGHGFSLVNGFSGEVTREGLESLKNNPKVERIIFDKVYTVNLAESVPMINASRTHAYQVDGQNLTGAGETICILDTGIDTDHPSFEGKIIGCQTFIDGTTTCEDDHGHGTHVAGIASAKGSVIGVAPGSNIAMMKVCDSGGGCTSSDLLSGIEWCVANKGSLNISVMSMSLGDGGEYTSANCPSDIIDTGLESAFNSGVFIVSASGNNHYTSGISYPACNEYVTSVGAVTKSDSITYNRGGDLLTLLAPGLSITSTWKGGGTATLSGTSMSAPHVAGAAAVLQQFARANAGALTQAQIRNAFNSTGKPIYDSSSGGTYSRVSLFEAVKSLTDVSGPSLTMLLPLNMSYSTNSSIPLSYAANDINGINAAWYEIDGGGTVFILGDTTFDTAEGSHVLTLHANDSFGNEESVSTSFNVDMTSPTVVLSNPNNSYYISPVAFSFSLLEINPDSCSLYGSWDGWHLNQTKLAPENSFTASLEDGSYEWNIGCNDTANNLGFGSENFTANIDSTAPEVVISSPENKTYDNYTGIALDFSASDLNLDSCWYSLDDNNLSLAGCANTSFDTVDGHHNILVFANDSAGNEGFAELVFTVDTVIPSLVLSSPSEGETLSSDVNFTYSVEDVQVSNCSLLINGTVNLTEEDVQVFTLQQFSASLTDDWYYWSVSCADPFNNVNFSEERNFRVCTESWTCNAWSTCSNSQQARTCTDANSCGTTNNKPVESQSCSDPQPPSSSGSSGGGGGGGSKKIASSVPPQVIKKEETPKPAEEKPVTEQQPEPKKGEPEVVKEQVQTTSLESATGSTTAPSEPSAMGISTRAVNSIKSNKIAVGGFVFVIAVMVSLHFIFFKKYLASKKKNSNKSWLEKINFFKSYRELLNPKKP